MDTRRRFPLLVATTLLALLTACRTPPTEVLVVVDTDAPLRVQSMHAVISRGSTVSAHPETRSWDRTMASAFAFPTSFAIVPGTAANDGTVRLDVSLQFAPAVAGQPALTVVRTARFRFTPHVPTYVRLFIPVSCGAEIAMSSLCPTGHSPCSQSDYCEAQTPALTCGDDGRCITPDVTPLPLGPDGSVPVDASRDATTDAPDGCTPACGARHCGPDGCGGSCGTCGATQQCSVGGICQCVPVCTGRTCGGDGCGGSCGACSSGQICSAAGACAMCVAGAACDTGVPCTTGSAVCTGTSPSCMRTGSVAAGTSCSGGVCDGSGTCVACSAGMMCSTGNPCATAQIVCASGAAVCTAMGSVPAGTSCPGGVCSASGMCVACSVGAACATGNPCTTGSVECGSGAPICTTAGNVSAGTACPGGVCNGTGTCVACSAGMSCGTGNPCTTGRIGCRSGAAVCDVSGNIAAGMTCPGGVCDGAGHCSGCSAGASCASPMGECYDGVIGCSTGMPVCMTTTARTAGMGCTGGVCSGSGTCIACSEGAMCGTGNECTTGTIACGSGTPVCSFAGNVPAGSMCTGGVCNGSGTCVACVTGMPCVTGNPCTNGAIGCASGGPSCAPSTNVGAGVACSGGVCNGAGTCVSCNPGMPCSTGNECTNGMIQCGSGAAVCAAAGNVTAGVMCTGGVCNSSGACVPCVQGMVCGASDECHANGTLQCGSGMPICSLGLSRADYASCTGGYCLSGSCHSCTPQVGCTTGMPGTVCGDPIGIAPFAAQGPGAFQSTPGSSYQSTIGVTFAIPVNSVTVTINDPDFAGNYMVAYDSVGGMLGTVSFVGDGLPGTYSSDTQSISASGIARVDLVPDPADYVWYSGFTFSGCL